MKKIPFYRYAVWILLAGAILSMAVGYILLLSVPTAGFPLVQIRSGFVPDGGTYYAVYKDNQERVFELGTTPKSRMYPLDLPLLFLVAENGPRVYPYFRRYPDTFPIRAIAAPCSSLESELQEFLQLLSESNRPENHETVDVINRVIERNRQYCK